MTLCCSGRFARDASEQPASAARCDMVLHRAFRARHLKHEMQHLASTGSRKIVLQFPAIKRGEGTVD